MTRRVVVLLAGLITVCGSAAPAQAIVNGRSARAGEAPFTVALVAHGQPAASGLFCGGTLIAPDVVLTAAHCLVGQRASRVDAIIGRRRLDVVGGQRVGGAAIAVDPAYRSATNVHDFAELRLGRAVAEAVAIGLPADPQDRTAEGTAATLFGWGLVSRRSGTISRRLRAADLVVRSDRFCGARYPGDFRPRQALCASSPTAAASADGCEGDSGGPLVVAGSAGPVIVGVVSYAYAACSSARYPEVFAEVADGLGWIRAQRDRWGR